MEKLKKATKMAIKSQPPGEGLEEVKVEMTKTRKTRYRTKGILPKKRRWIYPQGTGIDDESERSEEKRIRRLLKWKIRGKLKYGLFKTRLVAIEWKSPRR